MGNRFNTNRQRRGGMECSHSSLKQIIGLIKQNKDFIFGFTLLFILILIIKAFHDWGKYAQLERVYC